jgi:hypothetical protein
MLSKTLSVALVIAVCQAQPLTKLFKTLGHASQAPFSLQARNTTTLEGNSTNFSIPVIPEEFSCFTKEFTWDNQEKLRGDPRKQAIKHSFVKVSAKFDRVYIETTDE